MEAEENVEVVLKVDVKVNTDVEAKLETELDILMDLKVQADFKQREIRCGSRSGHRNVDCRSGN